MAIDLISPKDSQILQEMEGPMMQQEYLYLNEWLGRN